jgi:hypothetical protein
MLWESATKSRKEKHYCHQIHQAVLLFLTVQLRWYQETALLSVLRGGGLVTGEPQRFLDEFCIKGQHCAEILFHLGRLN